MALETLTPKQRRFADQYLGPARGNATEAARMAGYSDAEVSGYNCKQNQAIRAYIDERLNSETLSSAEVLAELTAIARAEWRNFVQERTNYKGETLDSRLDLGDKVKALELLGKYHKLFTEKQEQTGALEVRVVYDDAKPVAGDGED